MNAVTYEEPTSQEHVLLAAAFRSLLPWVEQVGRFEIGEQPVPWGLKDVDPSDDQRRELTLAALRASERLLRQFFDDSPISVAVFDPAGWLLHVNRAFGAMLGYAAEDLTARNIDELLHPDDVPSIQERRRMLIEGKCHEFQITARFGSGCRRVVWTRMSGRLEQNAGDRPPQIFAHLVDLTEFEQMAKNSEREAQENRWNNWDPDRYV